MRSGRYVFEVSCDGARHPAGLARTGEYTADNKHLAFMKARADGWYIAAAITGDLCPYCKRRRHLPK